MHTMSAGPLIPFFDRFKLAPSEPAGVRLTPAAMSLSVPLTVPLAKLPPDVPVAASHTPDVCDPLTRMP